MHDRFIEEILRKAVRGYDGPTLERPKEILPKIIKPKSIRELAEIEEQEKIEKFAKTLAKVIPQYTKTSSRLSVICEECAEDMPADIMYFTRAMEMIRRKDGLDPLKGPHCDECFGYLAFGLVDSRAIVNTFHRITPVIPPREENYEGGPF